MRASCQPVRLHAAPQPLDEDVVTPAPLAVHALARADARCVFRPIVTDRFGIVTVSNGMNAPTRTIELQRAAESARDKDRCARGAAMQHREGLVAQLAQRKLMRHLGWQAVGEELWALCKARGQLDAQRLAVSFASPKHFKPGRFGSTRTARLATWRLSEV